jgi:hypothetical protein
VGQGVGTAATLGIKHGIDPEEMVGNSSFIHQVQQQLLLDDCFIPGVKHEDSKDLALLANVNASSSIVEGNPQNVLSGETRAVHGHNGVKPHLTNASSHRWMSNPVDHFPVWIELEWENPQEINWIQIIFDTGMHRPLTQTYMNDFYGSELIWGPQPETVKSFRLSYAPQDSNELIDLIKESNNYQRRTAYHFQSVYLKRLRLTVEQMWGINHGRVCEIRCYLK